MAEPLEVSTRKLADLIGRLPIEDAVLVQETIEAMVEFGVSLPRAFANIEAAGLMATGEWKGRHEDAEREGYRKALAWWLDAGRRYG